MDSQVQEIKDKLNIVDVVGQYVQLRKAGRNYTARCPFHKEKTPSFMVSPERGTYICFGCGEKGDAFSFVQKMDGVDFPTALKQLAEKAGVELHHKFTPKAENKEKDERLRDALEAAAAFYQQQLSEHAQARAYVHSRGVHDETAREWRVGYAPAEWRTLCEQLQSLGFSADDLVDTGLAIRSQKQQGEIYDRFRGRIMFPISDLGGKVIGFSGRFFEAMPSDGRPREETEPAKYVNSPETSLFKKSRTLYGLDKAKNHMRKADCILLVEGQFDVVLSHQSGLPIAVALSGTAFTQEHLSLMSRFSKRLVLALDADQAGIRAGLKSAHMALAAGFDVKVPTFPPDKDPADLARENPELLKAAVRTSKSAVEFFLEVLRAGARDERAYQKTVEAQVLPLIAAMQSQIERDHFIALVARKLMVSEAAVRAEVLRQPHIMVADDAPITEHTAIEMELTSQERCAGMLLVQPELSDETRARVEALLGKERVDALKARIEPEAEALRFEFDALGEDSEKSTQALLASLERLTLEEEIKGLRDRLYRGEGSMTTMAQELAALKRRQEELRK